MENELLEPKAQDSSGSGGMLPKKIFKIWPLRMHFLHSGARIRVFEQNRKHKSPLNFSEFRQDSFVFHE